MEVREEGGKGGEGMGEWREEEGEDRGKGMEGKGRRGRGREGMGKGCGREEGSYEEKYEEQFPFTCM